MVHVDRAPALADLVTAQDVRAAWETVGLDQQRAVVNLLYTVTLLPSLPGRISPELESVKMGADMTGRGRPRARGGTANCVRLARSTQSR